jgi:hypothetical protein
MRTVVGRRDSHAMTTPRTACGDAGIAVVQAGYGSDTPIAVTDAEQGDEPGEYRLTPGFVHRHADTLVDLQLQRSAPARCPVTPVRVGEDVSADPGA